MAPLSSALRTCGLIFVYISTVLCADTEPSEPWIVSFSVEEKLCTESICKYLLNVSGGEFLGYLSWRLTPDEGVRGGVCNVIYPSYELREVLTTKWYTSVNITVPYSGDRIYFCLLHSEQKNVPFGGKWIHQGPEFYLDPKNDKISNTKAEKTIQTQEDNADKGQVVTEIAGESESKASNLEREWTDLTHDTDVNFLPGVARPTREEANDIEVLYNNKYIPLNDVESIQAPNVIHNTNDARLHQVAVTDGELRDLADGLNYEDVQERVSNDIEERSKREAAMDGETNDFTSADAELRLINRDTITETVDNKEMDLKDRKERYTRQIGKNKTSEGTLTNELQMYSTISSVKQFDATLQIEGLRIEEVDGNKMTVNGDGVPSVLADTKFVLRLFGQGLTDRTIIAFTREALDYGKPCKFLLKGEYIVRSNSISQYSALVDVFAPQPDIDSPTLYICAKNLKPDTDPWNDQEKYYHQGSETYKALASHNSLLPLWVSLCLIVFCLMFSALFSGLNLGLMSLDRTELKIISNTGTDAERKYARAIMPVRDHGNYLLCSILLGNVAVNSTFTILLDGLTSGLFAVIFSTIAIVLFGEITPQAICSRHGLMVGAKTIVVTKAVMGLTAPLAYPVSKLLDYFLGEEIGSVYNRERLKELVKVTTDVNDLDKDEVNIISGALELRKKTVSNVMTKLEDVFMLPISSVLDFETMSEIIKSGFSRIPVYENERTNIITVLFIKDLAFVDPDDNTPLRTLCQYYQNPCNFVFEDVTLDVMFRQFKDGHKGHMAFVHRINSEGEGDPFYETIGLVTLEDVIEELIQAEIVDETDVFTDNKSKRRRTRPQNKLQDFAAFAEKHEQQRIHISPQLTLATFQFLSSSVDAFKPDVVSESVLRRMLRQDVIYYIKLKGKDRKDPSTYVFQQGKPVDYFVLILEGRVEVTVGRENLVFEAGPFTYFGVQALTQNVGVAESPTPSAMGSLQNINMDSMLRHTFVPDYSVRAITELYYLTVKRSLYMAAKRATLMEKGALSKGATNEQFDTEVDKLFQSVDEDISVSGDHKTPSRQVSPNPPPASASPHTRASFAAALPPETRNGIYRADSLVEEQEKLLK